VEPVAVNCDGEPKEVESAEPFNFTTAPPRKSLPFTVRVMLPVSIGFGVTELIAGAGYRMVTDAVPTAEGAATLVAWTVTVAGFGTADGAEYSPLAST